jgi:diguanylate cyclase (GGDEF)-like protein
MELARSPRYRQPLALLLVDSDGLKRINDRLGHHAGDEAIRRLADVIRSQLRETDVAARWGGDEFAVLAPSTSTGAALALAERIRALIPQQGAQWRLSGSLGVAAIDLQADKDVVDSATLMRAAEAALYEAKRAGRNRVVAQPRGIPRTRSTRPSGPRTRLQWELFRTAHGKARTEQGREKSDSCPAQELLRSAG